MKTKFAIINIILFFLIFSAFASGEEINGHVVRVTDGDTIVVLTQDRKEFKIRFLGIDAPEKKQPFGQASRKHLASIIAGDTVRVEFEKRDRYGRILGVVYNSEDQNLNQIQIQYGFAWHYRQYSKDPLLQSLEDQAREKRLGLWSDSVPIPPWDWRRGCRP